MNPIAVLLNILWFIFGGGAIAALLWLVFGLIFAVTVIGLPFAFAAFRIANYTAFPYGRELREVELLGEERILGTSIANVLWIIFAGIWLAIGHALTGIALCLTLIGIPFGWAHFKLALACFAPLGKRIVSSD